MKLSLTGESQLIENPTDAVETIASGPEDTFDAGLDVEADTVVDDVTDLTDA